MDRFLFLTRWVLALVAPFIVVAITSAVIVGGTLGLCELIWGPCEVCGHMDEICSLHPWFLHLNAAIVGVICGLIFPVCFYLIVPGSGKCFVLTFVGLLLGIMLMLWLGLGAIFTVISMPFPFSLAGGPHVTLGVTGGISVILSCWLVTRRSRRLLSNG